jgi:hypothetical protein
LGLATNLVPPEQVGFSIFIEVTIADNIPIDIRTAKDSVY